MFAMTSMGAKVIDSVNVGHSPYVFKVSGQACHRIGSLTPTPGARPKYAQLYLFDMEHEVTNRMKIVSSSWTSFHVNEIIIRILGDVDAHGDVFSFSVASEVVGLVVGDIGHTDVGTK
jgi:hypothetical protein